MFNLKNFLKKYNLFMLFLIVIILWGFFGAITGEGFLSSRKHIKFISSNEHNGNTFDWYVFCNHYSKYRFISRFYVRIASEE